MAQTQAPPAQPGLLFDAPGGPGGGTQWGEGYDTNKGINTVLSQGAQTQMVGVLPFRQTDVVCDWIWNLKIVQTYAAGTSVLTNSAFAPFNAIQACQLLIQNQYSSVKVESGIDLYIFNNLRPARQIRNGGEVLLGADPAGSPVGGTATGYYTTALAQANQFAAVWTNSAASWQTILRLPAAQWFDSYWDLSVDGNPMAPPHAALVSPQFMAGTTRQIAPQVLFAAGTVATLDNGPVNIGAGTGSFAGNATSTFKRIAIYAGDPSVLPPVYAWQYAWQTQRFSASGVSRVDLLLPLEWGQVLALYVRMFDPSANGGLGAPININTVTKAQVQYGSALLRFDDTPDECQERFLKQHQWLPPQGAMIWDLALDDRAQMTNKRALNLLTTAGCLVHLEFTGALSNTAYIVLGGECLVYVS